MKNAVVTRKPFFFHFKTINKFFVHNIMRNQGRYGLLQPVLQGKVPGKRSADRKGSLQ